MIHTCSPFDNVRFSTGGSFSAGSGPSAGGFDRSGVCCADTTVTATTAAQTPQRTRDHKDAFVIFVSL